MRKTILMLILVFAVGCEPNGRTMPTRRASSIELTNEGDFRCDNAETDALGRVIYAEGIMYLAYIDDFGNHLDMPNLRMDRGFEWANYAVNDGGPIYYWNTDRTGVRSSGVTNEDGVVVCTAFREFAPIIWRPHYAGAEYCRPGTGGSDCKAVPTFGTSNMLDNREPHPYPYVRWLESGVDYYGGFKWSGTPKDATAFDPRRRKKPENFSSLDNLLTSEMFAVLQGDLEVAPDSGIRVLNLSLITQRGENGEGFVVEEAGAFMPSNNTDEELIFKHGSPYMYSYTFATAEPSDIIGRLFSATVQSNLAEATVGIEVIQSSSDGYVHVARTDYFMPMDEEFYTEDQTVVDMYDRWADDNYDFDDPNFVPDPNRIRPVLVIPMESEGDTLSITFVIDSSVLIEAFGSWLTDSKVFDTNQDGIVNLKDWFVE